MSYEVVTQTTHLKHIDTDNNLKKKNLNVITCTGVEHKDMSVLQRALKE